MHSKFLSRDAEATGLQAAYERACGRRSQPAGIVVHRIQRDPSQVEDRCNIHFPENFELHWEQTRIHHPTEENANQRYQAIHYTVSLNDARTALAEYTKFKGLRCEIQIQTILIHAWAEHRTTSRTSDQRAKDLASERWSPSRRGSPRLWTSTCSLPGTSSKRCSTTSNG